MSALLVGGMTGAATIGAAPAFASVTCVDDLNTAPVTVWPLPADSGSTLGDFPTVRVVYDPGCVFYNNTGEGRWYMQVTYEGGDGYVWIQRLVDGSSHTCAYDNGGVTGSIGSSPCTLYTY